MCDSDEIGKKNKLKIEINWWFIQIIRRNNKKGVKNQYLNTDF